MLPTSNAELEAIEAAENGCADGVGRSWATSSPEGSLQAATAENALEDEPGRLPRGEPERTTDADGWVALDFQDDGVNEGRAMAERAGDGWFVRRVIDCRADEAVAEDETTTSAEPRARFASIPPTCTVLARRTVLTNELFSSHRRGSE